MNLSSNNTSTQPDYFKHIEYDFCTGTFFLLRVSSGLVSKRQIFPNEDGYLLFYRQGTKFKIKANKVALELGTARLLDDNKVVLHKNLDVNDYRLQNLCAVTRTVYKKVKEAHRSRKDISIIAVEQDPNSVEYTKIDYKMPLALMLGNETFGILPKTLKLADHIAEIPMWGINKSLNVIVSAAIVSYHVMNQTTRQ